MGYFGSMYGSSYGANAPSTSNMMFMPNAYGGYSTVAGGSPAGAAATQQLQALRGILAGARSQPTTMGQTALQTLAPFMQMAVTPPDMMQRLGQTFGGVGMNFGQVLGQAKQYVENMGKTDEQKQEVRYGLGGGPATFIPKPKEKGSSAGGTSGGVGGAAGGSGQPTSPLGYLSGIFGQYGGGGSFGSGWGR